MNPDIFFDLSRLEGIIPALEYAHAVAYVKKAAETGELGDVCRDQSRNHRIHRHKG